MPLRAVHHYCGDHGCVERFQLACLTCGLYGCADADHAGRASLCATERARLQARFRRAARKARRAARRGLA